VHRPVQVKCSQTNNDTMAKTAMIKNRPLNIHVAKGSSAERAFRSVAGLPGQSTQPEAIATGIQPTPAHDLHFHGGKTIANLAFKNLYVGGSSAWQNSDIHSIDNALAGAMSE